MLDCHSWHNYLQVGAYDRRELLEQGVEAAGVVRGEEGVTLLMAACHQVIQSKYDNLLDLSLCRVWSTE